MAAVAEPNKSLGVEVLVPVVPGDIAVAVYTPRKGVVAEGEGAKTSDRLDGG